MKSQKLIELEREGLAIAEEARALLGDLGGVTDNKQIDDGFRKHDMLMRKYDQNKLDQDAQRSMDEERENREDRRPGFYAEVSGVDDPSGFSSYATRAESSGWVDERGKPVRILGPGDKMAAHRSEGVALGDTVRAMLTGPRNDFERRALVEGTDSAGGYTVPAPLAAEFIDKLRARSVVNRAGARIVPMSSATLAMARIDSDPTVAWRTEGGSINVSEPTFGRVQLNANSLACLVKVSRELFADTVNAGSAIERALTAAAAVEVDRALLFGDGTGGTPTGIAETSGINAVSMGTNGAALDGYGKLIDAIYELQVDNVDMVTARIGHPRTAAALAKLVDTTGNPLVAPKMVADVPEMWTTGVPINETQGTATDASSLIFGDFRDLLIGMREEMNVRLLTELYAGTGHIGIVLHLRLDGQLARKESFCKLSGIIPA